MNVNDLLAEIKAKHTFASYDIFFYSFWIMLKLIGYTIYQIAVDRE